MTLQDREMKAAGEKKNLTTASSATAARERF
jgi:hypothetical protein